MSQIPLPFGNFDHFSFELFVPGPNQTVVDKLKNMARNYPGEYIYLWGPRGTGKSHLLQAACGLASSSGHKPGYIPLSGADEITPDILCGLETLDIVCIDDLDAVRHDSSWELGLFSLYNRLRDMDVSLVISSRTNPRGNTADLADLKSRLASGLSYYLKPLDEGERMNALKLRASSRGFEIPDEVLTYLSRRIPRDMHTLLDWLDRLDSASLISKKRLSVNLVRELLEKDGA